MKLSSDLPSGWIMLKGVLFLFILIAASGLVIFLDEKPIRIFALLCVIWSSARIYDFFFYVIENYLDGSFKFTGRWSTVHHLVRKRRR